MRKLKYQISLNITMGINCCFAHLGLKDSVLQSLAYQQVFTVWNGLEGGKNERRGVGEGSGTRS